MKGDFDKNGDITLDEMVDFFQSTGMQVVTMGFDDQPEALKRVEDSRWIDSYCNHNSESLRRRATVNDKTGNGRNGSNGDSSSGNR